jgi:hypothetical protein
VFIGKQDVAVVAKDEFGNRSDNAFAVGTGNEKDGGVVHSLLAVTQFMATEASVHCAERSLSSPWLQTHKANPQVQLKRQSKEKEG